MDGKQAARKGIEDARRQRERAATLREKADEQLVAACLRARGAGVPMTEIAKLAGFSTRAALYKFLRRRRATLPPQV